MATKIRPIVSKKREYYISKHRYYELKHFCLQYNEWKKILLYKYSPSSKSIIFHTDHNPEFDDPVGNEALRAEEAEKNIKLVEDSAELTDKFLSPYILECVTQERSYSYLKMVLNMPCGRDHFYISYHKFFWILDKQKRYA